MRDTVLYIRGQFPFEADPRIPVHLLKAAKAVLELEPDELDRVAHDLDEHTGFLDGETARAIIGSTVADEEKAGMLAVAVVGLDEFFRNTGLNVEAFLSRVDVALKDERSRVAATLTQAELNELRRRLPLVVKRYLGLDRQAKAQSLSAATGLPLEDIRLVCDLRPVFNPEHTAVDGVIPYTILKAVCKGADGLPVQLEAILSGAQVVDLAKRASEAETKLRTLAELLTAKGIAVPSVDLTKQEG